MLTSYLVDEIRDIRAAIKTERHLIAESVDILKRHVRAGSKMRNMMEAERGLIIQSSRNIRRHEVILAKVEARLALLAHT